MKIRDVTGKAMDPQLCEIMEFFRGENVTFQMKSNSSYQSFLDSIFVIIIFSISLSARIWNIQTPETVVFDEHRYGQYINCYCNGSFFFDVQPPFGKLVLYQIAKFYKYNCDYDFQRSNVKKQQTSSFIPLRYGVCFISSFCAPIIYSVLRICGVSRLPSFVSGLMLSLDSSMIVESRYIIPDGILLTLIALHLFILSVGFESYSPLFSGITLGLCISTKFAAFSLIPFSIFVTLKKIQPFNTRGIIVMLFTAFIIFDLLTVLHMSFLPDQSDDVDEYLPVSLQQHMFLERDPGRFITDAIFLSLTMFIKGFRNNRFNPYQSDPLSWPLLTGIWVRGWDRSSNREIVLMGNPVVYYLGFASVVMLMIRFRKLTRNVVSYAGIGYLLSYIPYFLTTKTMFLSDYQIPLLFAVISFGPMFDRIIYNQRTRNLFCFSIICAILFTYSYYSPFIYGNYVPNLEKRVTNPVWSKGSKKHQHLVDDFLGLDI